MNDCSKCAWLPWEKCLWMLYLVAIVVLTAIILGNLTAPTDEVGQVPRKPPVVHGR